MTIAGDGVGVDGGGDTTIGEDELLVKSLREQLRSRAFSIDESVGPMLRDAAMSMVPEFSPRGLLKLGAKKRNSLGFALALATYRDLWLTYDRAYWAGGRRWRSQSEAVAHLGQGALTT